MTELKTTTSNSWTRLQVLALGAFSLLLGLCGGWLIRRSFAAGKVAPSQSVSASAQTPAPGQTSTPSAQELKQAADTQAVPLLQQLKNDPSNADILSQLGNLYYDAKQYAEAIDYYERSLTSQPSNNSVRTDLGTAYWYSGNADKAIAEFNQVLSTEPSKPDTLFNLGVVKWQGKKDAQGAIAAWQKLLDTNPGYPNKEAVQNLIVQAQGR